MHESHVFNSIPTSQLSILRPDSLAQPPLYHERMSPMLSPAAPDLRCTDNLATHTAPICFILTSVDLREFAPAAWGQNGWPVWQTWELGHAGRLTSCDSSCRLPSFTRGQNRLAGLADPGPRPTRASPSRDVYPAPDGDEDCMHACSTIAVPLLVLPAVACHWPSPPLPLPLALAAVALAVGPALRAPTVAPYAPPPSRPMRRHHRAPRVATIAPHAPLPLHPMATE